MSQGWSKLLDIGTLADGREEIQFSIPMSEFPRLLPQLASAEGEAHGSVRFSRESRLPIADVQVRAHAQLACQRCLGPMHWDADSESRAAVVLSSAEADTVPEGVETVLAPEGRISIRDLVEEELLLSWPLVPRHDYECAAAEAADPAAQAAESDETNRPFAQLSELFKRQ